MQKLRKIIHGPDRLGILVEGLNLGKAQPFLIDMDNRFLLYLYIHKIERLETFDTAECKKWKIYTRVDTVQSLASAHLVKSFSPEKNPTHKAYYDLYLKEIRKTIFVTLEYTTRNYTGKVISVRRKK
jgi:hypothetical protein